MEKKLSKQELYREACRVAASLIETMDLYGFWSEDRVNEAFADKPGRDGQLQQLIRAKMRVVAMLRCKSMPRARGPK